MENGEVYTFGNNTYGQLGVSDTSHVGPVKVNLPSVIIQIAAGSNHSVALTSTGEVYTFGNNVVRYVLNNNICCVTDFGKKYNKSTRMKSIIYISLRTYKLLCKAASVLSGKST